MKVFNQKPSSKILPNKEQQQLLKKGEQRLSSEVMLLGRSLVAPPPTEQTYRNSVDGTPIPDDADISRLFKTASTSIRDARNILKSSPELCMGIDIYIAGLLSPNDVSAPDLNITSNATGLLTPIKSKLLEVVREWVKDEYKIDTRLKEWVFKAKYLQGAVPLGIVPLTAIDNIINEKDKERKRVSLESYDSDTGLLKNGFYKPTGMLGAGLTDPESEKPKRKGAMFSSLKVALESSGQAGTTADVNNTFNLSEEQRKMILAADKENGQQIIDALSNIYIHDNPEVLKLPNIAAAMAKKSVLKQFSPLYSMALEDDDDEQHQETTHSNAKVINLEKGQLVYPDRNFSLREVISLRPSDIYENVGHPIIQEFPYDSCFPIAPPGLPDKHLGYIIALDSTGSPLTMTEELMDHTDATDVTLQTSTGIMGTQVLSQMGDNSVDGITNLRYGAANPVAGRLFNTFLVADIKERLKNGIYNGVELDVRFTEVFLQQMWRRAIQGQQVQFLYVPTELLTYIAFEYNEFGMGESKLSKHRDVAIIASTVQVANALTAINNSIQHKKATISFDDDEVDAMDTVEKLQQYIVRAQNASALFTSSNTQDQLNHILNSGWNFSYENGMGAFPGTSFDIEYLTREANTIDNEYLDTINKRLIMLSGVSPEIVDMSQDVEFAQSYITGHQLRAQQAALEQQALCVGVTRFIRNFCMNSQKIIKKLHTIIKEAKASDSGELKSSKVSTRELIEEFIESIETSLPKPDTTKLEAMSDVLEKHEAYIDKVIDYYFNDPLFESSEVGEKLGEKAELFKTVWRSSYMRNVLQTNNLVPKQIQALHGNIDEDEDFIDPFAETEQFIKNFSKLLIQHEGEISKLRVRNDNIMQNLEDRASDESNDDGGGDDEDVDSSNDDANDNDAGDNSTDGGDGDDPFDEGDDLFGDAGGADNPLG